MITLDMVKRGYEQGIVRLIESPRGDGPVCAIGDDWFYFSVEAEKSLGDVMEKAIEGEIGVEEFRSLVPSGDIVNGIFGALEELSIEIEDEYLYYEAFLNENLMEKTVGSLREQAERFVRENPSLAKQIGSVIVREGWKAAIRDAISERKDTRLEDFSEEDMERMAQRFGVLLQDSDRHAHVLWDVTDRVIDERLRKNQHAHTGAHKGVFCVSKELCDAAVEAAVLSIRGVGVDMGSGCYVLNSFEIDGEQLNLYMEICKMEDDLDGLYYSVYYAVEIEDGDNLFSDWAYTDHLDADELKEAVFEIANTDFSKDIRKELNQDRALEGSLEQKMKDAESERKTPSKGNGVSEREER